LKFIMNYA